MTDAPPARLYRADWLTDAHHVSEVNIWSGPSSEYILATPSAIAASPEGAALIREAEERGMKRAMPTDQAIQDLADHIWRVHPRELDEGGYASKRFGGKYENPLAAWYADQIKALCRGAVIRAEAAAIRAAKGEPE